MVLLRRERMLLWGVVAVGYRGVLKVFEGCAHWGVEGTFLGSRGSILDSLNLVGQVYKHLPDHYCMTR